MNKTNKDILANIIKIRADRNLTQAAVADAINVDHTTYSKLESGQTKLSVERLEEIANVFNMRIIDVLTYPEVYVSADSLPAEKNKKPRILLQIELDEDKKEDIMKMVFGEKNMNQFNK